MKSSDLVSNYPRLWHMAEDGSCDSIRDRGLLSTSVLHDLYGVGGDLRHSLESRLRRNSVTIRRDGLPPAVIRDQKPMQESKLLRCLLDGLTAEEWYRTLNARVFFWASPDRLAGLFDAKAYRRRPQLILTIDTAGLVAAHGGQH